MFLLKHLLFLLTAYYVITGTESKGFRDDYTYYDAVGGFLKFHVVPTEWTEARQRCYLEGAVLASPATRELQAALNEELKKISSQSGRIHTGVHSRFFKGYFYSLEGTPLYKMALQWAAGEPDNAGNKEDCIAYEDGKIADVSCSELLPFVCYKKNIRSSDMPCGVDDQEYEYVPKTGQCYKFHYNSLPFDGASKTCSAEGGYLAIINSDEEAAVLKDLYSKRYDNYTDVIYLGIYKWGPDEVFRTVKGETFEEAGYSTWETGQPDNAGVFCGGMSANGKLDDIWCGLKKRFLCEIDVDSKPNTTV